MAPSKTAPRGAFELVDGPRRFALTEGALGVAASEARAILDRALARDPSLGADLARWLRRARPSAAIADDRAVLAELGRGGLGLIDLPSASRPSFEHAPELSDAPPVAVGAAEPIAELDLRFEIEVVDELGEALAGVELEWAQAGARGHVSTDGAGRARFTRPPGPSRAELEIADLDGLRELLRPRWARAERGQGRERLDADDERSVAPLNPALGRRRFAITAFRPHTVSIQPWVILARLFGPCFESNRSLLLPAALDGVARLRELCEARPDASLLVVGHADASGEPEINDPLSRERGESLAAYLRGEVDPWLERYEAEARRWGRREDAIMMSALVGAGVGGRRSLTRRFQAWFNDARSRGFVDGPALAEDGRVGPKTRRALVHAYQRRDGADAAVEREIEVHGCGESFPLEASERPAATAEDRELDRRLELFVFDGELGVLPEPPGEVSAPGDRVYPSWRARVVELHELEGKRRRPRAARALAVEGFAVGSCFVGPGVAAVVKPAQERLDDERAQLALFGHTDPSGAGDDNKALAEARAAAVRALLISDADALFDLAESQAWGADAYQAMLRGLSFIPGPIDGDPGPMTGAAVEAFAEAFDEGWLDGPAPSPGPSLDGPTRRAIVAAYVDEFGVGLDPELLLNGPASGCREFNPLEREAERERRVSLAIYDDPAEAPDPERLPCRAEDSEACELDRGAGLRCAFFREFVAPEPDPPVVEFFDFAWLRRADGQIHLSALTNAPDSDELRVELGVADGGLPLDPPSSASGDAPLGLRELGRVDGRIRNGVCFARWDPGDFDPFDPRQWFDADPEAPEIEGLPVPTFKLELGPHWAYATPPGRRLDRIALSGEVDREIFALLADGSYLRFDGRAGLQEAAEGEAAGLHVLALYPRDGLARPGGEG